MKCIAAILLLSIFTVIPGSAEARVKQSAVSVQIHTEKSVSGAGFKIKFVEMVEDSRCPEGTSCIWAGNAKVKIEIRGVQGGTKTFEINSATQPAVASYAGYQIKLASLTPKPAVDGKVDPNRYLATFEVTKKTGK